MPRFVLTRGALFPDIGLVYCSEDDAVLLIGRIIRMGMSGFSAYRNWLDHEDAPRAWQVVGDLKRLQEAVDELEHEVPLG